MAAADPSPAPQPAPLNLVTHNMLLSTCLMPLVGLMLSCGSSLSRSVFLFSSLCLFR